MIYLDCIVNWFYAPDMGGYFWSFVLVDLGEFVVFRIEPRKRGVAEIFCNQSQIQKKS